MEYSQGNDARNGSDVLDAGHCVSSEFRILGLPSNANTSKVFPALVTGVSYELRVAQLFLQEDRNGLKHRVKFSLVNALWAESGC